jgi:hypothetical protein
LDKSGTSRPAIDLPSYLGVEGDEAIQQQLRCARVLETAGSDEPEVHRGRILAFGIQTHADAIDVAKRRKELERSGKKAPTVEEIDQPHCAGIDEAIADRRRDDCARIEQEFGTFQAGEVLRADRVEAVTEGTGRHSEEPPVVFTVPVSVRRVPRSPRPRQQRRVFRQELPQTFDVIVMDDAAGFGYGPLESSAEALFDSFQPGNPYSRASTSWASRWDIGSLA